MLCYEMMIKNAGQKGEKGRKLLFLQLRLKQNRKIMSI